MRNTAALSPNDMPQRPPNSKLTSRVARPRRQHQPQTRTSSPIPARNPSAATRPRLPDKPLPITGFIDVPRLRGRQLCESRGRAVSEDVETYRGRAEHARLAAKSIFDKQQRLIFEKLASSYEAKANEVEALQRGPSVNPEN